MPTLASPLTENTSLPEAAAVVTASKRSEEVAPALETVSRAAGSVVPTPTLAVLLL